MEPWHGRRGKIDQGSGGVCGITRAHHSLLLMVAMVAMMGGVLLWEASPLVASGMAQSPVLKVPANGFEDQANAFESRSFLRTPPVARPNEDLTESDLTPVVDETEPETIVTPGGTDEEANPNSSTTASPPGSHKISTDETATTSPEETGEASLPEELEVETGKGSKETSNGTSIESRLTPEEKAEIDVEASVVDEVESVTVAVNATDNDKDKSKADTTGAKRDWGLCDYTVGKWVLDNTRPLYSGLECKMWLSPGFSCRLNKHPDKLLDRYRWQPDGCDLPVFNASAVLEMLRNKVVAFVGDSLGRQQLQSLLCMLTRGKNDTAIADIGSSFGFYTPPGERKPNGFAFRFDATNTTIMYKWSVTLARIQELNESDPLAPRALHLDLPEDFVEEFLPIVDIMVLNTGHHWNGGKMRQNRFAFYLGGKAVNATEEVSRVPVAYNATVHNVVHWMHNATKKTPEKLIYYRSLSPRHFRNGDWNTGGTCDTIQFGKDKQLHEGARVDPNAESAIIGTSVHLLNITSLSLERGETHVSKYGGGTGGQDCLHWCLPGIPDTWNEIFFADLAAKLQRQRELVSS